VSDGDDVGVMKLCYAYQSEEGTTGRGKEAYKSSRSTLLLTKQRKEM
jgi:hypothetical protein